MLGFLAIFIVSLGIVSASLDACKTEYKTTEKVSVKSTGVLCNNLASNDSVKVYVVEDKEASSVVIISEKDVKNSVFSCTEIWATPTVGEFDVFADCVGNKVYDTLEPYGSFAVKSSPGKMTAAKGVFSILEHSWSYDSEDPIFENEMLQINLKAEAEDIELTNISVKASGSGDEKTIDQIEVYYDANKNGKLEATDELIASSQPAFTEDNGAVVLLPDFILENGQTETFLVYYIMKNDSALGDYILTVNSVVGQGVVSQTIIRATGLPIDSDKTIVSAEKTCMGQSVLEFNPNPAVINQNTTAKISGITGCSNIKASVRANPCESILPQEICSCVSNGTGCECSFTATRNATYNLCIDKNNDKDFVDLGEFSSTEFGVLEPAKPVKNQTVLNANVTANETTNETITEIEPGITGGVVEELREKIADAGSLFVLLEITLLFMLLVLVMILFKLKRPSSE